MTHILRDGLHWCRCGDHYVFLDVPHDRYFRLPAGAEAAFAALVHGADAGAAALRPLITAGLLQRRADAGPLRPSDIAPPRGDFEVGPGRSATGDVLRVLVAEIQARRRIRRGGLCALLAGAAGPVRPAHEPGRLARIVAASGAAGLVLPVHDRCLVRSAALARLCRRSGFPARLVVGVRLDPFRAHCWAELAGEVLTRDFEEARLFTPILAVG